MAETEQYRVPEMKRIKAIHLVGIGGSGMSGIAEVLLNQGYNISGSDVRANESTRRLSSQGALIYFKHDASFVDQIDLVVVSSAIAKDNVEVVAAKLKGIPVIQRAEMLGELMRYRHGIAVAGTHGKTTTTSMVAEILSLGNLSPTFVIGGILNSAGSGAFLGSGQHIVVEADESDGSFLKLNPLSSVITNIDCDHMATYDYDFDKLKDSFIQFANNLPFYGTIALCIDDPNVVDIMGDISRTALTYGFDRNAAFRASEVSIDLDSKWSFKVDRGSSFSQLNIDLPVPGYHNVQNALAAIAIATDEGVEDRVITEALSGFSGVGRRFEVVPSVKVAGREFIMVDDYGHHPTEVKTVIETARRSWPGKRMGMIYQPHRYSRTRDLFHEFTSVLSLVDHLMLLDVYGAGEEPIQGVNSKELASSIEEDTKLYPLVYSGLDEAMLHLGDFIKDLDVLLVQGAGNVSGISNKLKKSNV